MADKRTPGGRVRRTPRGALVVSCSPRTAARSLGSARCRAHRGQCRRAGGVVGLLAEHSWRKKRRRTGRAALSANRATWVQQEW